MGDIQYFVLKQERNRAWGYTALCIETGENYSVSDIQCCVLKQERNEACLENEMKINPGKSKEISFTNPGRRN